MENKITCPKQESLPSFVQQDNEVSSSLYSALTHPSVRSRNKEDLFKRIRSGNDVLCRLPTRLDPNLQFSDDDEEEEDKKSSEEEDENAPPDVNKTPELRLRSQEPPCNKFMQNLALENDKRKFPRLEQVSRPFYSAMKPPNKAVGMDNLMMPQSENRIRTANVIPDILKKGNKNLMSQKEFKVPLKQPPLTSVSASRRSTSISDDIIMVNNKPYRALSVLGSGGSCKVYSCFDLETKSLVAIKCVDLKNTDPQIREGYKKEIEYLLKLQGSNRVIKMFDYEYRQNELFLILERGDIDFAKYISNEAKLKRLTPLMIKFYWAQMLEAVSDIHKYGIVHSDLKPANFLLVAGNIKLIDFGIATSVPEDKTSTFRDTQVGTLNYMSPEAITQLSSADNNKIHFKVGVKSDVWSLGCILYNLVYGYTPFHSIKTLMQKIYAITNPKYEITFNPLPDQNLIEVLKRCLKRNPKERASVDELLAHPYLTEDKTNSNSTESSKSSHLSSVVAQMQVLTPRRMSYLSKVVQELSENH